MAIATNLGFPRIGANRELKWAIEAYWAGKISQDKLLARAAHIRRENWVLQKRLGIEHIPSNDFSFYDQVLDTTLMVGAIPERYGQFTEAIDLDTYFAMARGRSESSAGPGVPAMEMTKWFDTNYHYLVPEHSLSNRRLQGAGQNTKQGGFPHPVVPHQCDFFTTLNSQVDAAKNPILPIIAVFHGLEPDDFRPAVWRGRYADPG